MSLYGGQGNGRGGSSGILRRACATGSLLARVLTLLAALTLAAGGPALARADAAGVGSGPVMVICSDGVAKTVVLDAEGNPVEQSGGAACLGRCPCCTLPAGVALTPDAPAPAVWEPVAATCVFHAIPASLRSHARSSHSARGPPPEDAA